MITNENLSSAYSSFRGSMYSYDYPKMGKGYIGKYKLINRSPPGSKPDRRFIKANVHNITKLSNIQKLQKLACSEANGTYDRRLPVNFDRGNKRSNSSFVFFNRK